MSHIIGTAGHIDHGKTALIRALTGQETDRLKEEKERGISIDLGFAYLDLSTGERVGIVDVPGHERFIRNMLAGAHGIDLVVLVVAADDGVMPQTEEHLDILHLLGISHGVVAITKADLVDAARLDAVRDEIHILLAGTTLEAVPVIPVSSATGVGLEALRQTIERLLASYARTASTGFFRLPMDRAFIMHGHGVVVTGTAVGGIIRPGDPVRVLPGGDEGRVRSVQVHGREVGEAAHGERVALNLVGVERTDLRRGHVICEPPLDRVTDRFDAWVEIRAAAGRPLASHEVVRLHVGTAEVIGKVVLLDGREHLPPRQSGYAQLVLREPVQVLCGDRFILRNQSAQRTIGGGQVLHPFAHRRQRGDRQILAALEDLRPGKTPAVAIRALMHIEPEVAVAPEFLAHACNLSLDVVHTALRTDPDLRPLPGPDTVSACTTATRWEGLRTAVVQTLEKFHRHSPLVPGLEMESLRTQIAPQLSPKLYRVLLDALVADGILARDDSTLRLPSHRISLKGEEEALAARAEALIAAGGLSPPDLKQVEAALAVPRGRLEPILRQLERQAKVVKVGSDLYFGAAALAQARQILLEYGRTHGDITAATFRDLLGASRKFSIALLDYFDRTGFTLRVGDVRRLRAVPK
ncbi:MAG: selenocysteine-specific translation elongation factor [Candidatus Binatia bacterium]